MKHIVTFLLLSIPILALCQSKSSIDVMMGGHSTYRGLSESSGLDYIIEIRKSEERALNWSTGVHYNRALSERSYLKTGIQVTAMGYKSAKISEFQWGDQVNDDFEFDPTIPTMEPGGFSEIQFVHTRHFIGIPVAVRHELNSRKLTPFIEGGVTPSYLLSAKSKRVTDVNTRTYDDSYPSQHNFHLVGYISAGIQFTPPTGFQWFAQPIFRYHFTATVDAPIKEHLYSVGLELGVRKPIK